MLLHMLQTPVCQPSRSAQKTMNVTGLKNLKMNAAEAGFFFCHRGEFFFSGLWFL